MKNIIFEQIWPLFRPKGPLVEVNLTPIGVNLGPVEANSQFVRMKFFVTAFTTSSD